MSSQADDDAQLIQTFAFDLAYRYCTLATGALLVYDIVLTFDAEVLLLWRQRLSIISTLYVVTRYMEVAAYISGLVLMFPRSNMPCVPWTVMEAMCTLLPYFSWAFFAGFRVYALTDRNTILAAIATILTATYVIPDMYEYTHRTFVNPPHCSQSYDLGPVFLSLLWLSRIGTLIGESIVILVTLRKTYPARSRSPLGCAASRYITDVILSNGIACFSIPLAFNVVMTAMALKGTPTSLLIGQCLACFRDSLSSILISRFLLDIGRLRTDISSGTSESVLTTHFASELSGVTYTLDLSLDSVGERSS